MASALCTNLEYKFYNGGWSGWLSELTGGYAGDSKRVVVIRFKTPDVANNVTATSLSLTIPYVRQDTAAESGNLFIKLYSSDPVTDSDICAIPTASTCDAKFAWDTGDQYVHYAKFTITKKINAGEHYYLVIGASTNFIQIGYKGYDDEYEFKYNYTAYTNGTSPSIAVTDGGNNTAKISGTLGKNGTNNEIKSAKIYYTTNGTEPTDSSSSIALVAKSSGSYSESVPISKDCTVRAMVICVFEHNETKASSSAAGAGVSVKYYKKPSNPGKPVIYFTKDKLTPKERIIYKWAAATQGNANSPVKGYRVRLYKNGINIPIWSTGSGTQLSVINSGSDYIYDRTGVADPLSISLGHEIHGFKPGDKVKLSIQAYALNGANEKLLSDVMTSDETVIYNAGTVKIKYNNIWQEGQVFVKYNNVWTEASSISSKTADGWKESK